MQVPIKTYMFYVLSKKKLLSLQVARDPACRWFYLCLMLLSAQVLCSLDNLYSRFRISYCSNEKGNDFNECDDDKERMLCSLNRGNFHEQ